MFTPKLYICTATDQTTTDVAVTLLTIVVGQLLPSHCQLPVLLSDKVELENKQRHQNLMP